MVKWLERRDCDRHALGSKYPRTILLCPCKRPFTALSPAWQSWQAVINFSHISISPEASQGNCLLCVLRLRRFPLSQEDKEIK